MSAMVQLGPLMLPTALLLMLACVAAGSLAARWQAGSAGAGEMPLMRVLLAGLLAARLAFVWRHREAYLQSPGKRAERARQPAAPDRGARAGGRRG
ncbi:hypothetical protein WLX12_23200, partial [Bordetella bronchiseptica]